jgi:hypothetical protein
VPHSHQGGAALVFKLEAALVQELTERDLVKPTEGSPRPLLLVDPLSGGQRGGLAIIGQFLGIGR